MKVFVALFALVAMAAAATEGSDHILHAVLQAKWNNFKATHGKEYHRDEEHQRLNNFLQATHKIETHNERYAKGLETFHMAHNKLSDLRFDEFLKTRLGAIQPEREDTNVTMFKSSPGWTAPDSIDWRIWGMVNKIKDQGDCGSCYSFASTACLETAYYRKHKKLVDFSEQQIVDCSKKYHVSGGCTGGWMFYVFQYLIDLNSQGSGLNLASNYPYEAKFGECRHKKSDNTAPMAKFVRLPKGDEKALQEAVASIGPIAVGYDASNRDFMLYKGGIFYSPTCNPARMSHAVAIVGYGTENSQDFWIVRNSWGDWWGEKGYFRMARNKGNHCGIATAASYPILS